MRPKALQASFAAASSGVLLSPATSLPKAASTVRGEVSSVPRLAGVKSDHADEVFAFFLIRVT